MRHLVLAPTDYAWRARPQAQALKLSKDAERRARGAALLALRVADGCGRGHTASAHVGS